VAEAYRFSLKRGSKIQAKVLLMVKSEPNIKAPKKGKENRKVGHFKMIIMESLKAISNNNEVEKA